MTANRFEASPNRTSSLRRYRRFEPSLVTLAHPSKSLWKCHSTMFGYDNTISEMQEDRLAHAYSLLPYVRFNPVNES